MPTLEQVEAARDLDREVLLALRELRVAPAGRIAHKIGDVTPQAVAASFQRLRKEGVVRRAGRSRTCWTAVDA